MNRKWSVVLMALATVCGRSNADTLPEQGFTNRMAITIAETHIESDLSNWTLVFDQSFDFDLTADNGPLHPSGTHSSRNGGGDIRFSSDQDGTNRLACDIRTWETSNTAGNRKCEVAVKVPTVSGSADTTLYMWWQHSTSTSNQPAASDTYGQYNAYDSYTLYRSNDGGATDRTSGQNGGTPYQTSTTSGKVGNALNFNGNTSRVAVGDLDGSRDTHTTRVCCRMTAIQSGNTSSRSYLLDLRGYNGANGANSIGLFVDGDKEINAFLHYGGSSYSQYIYVHGSSFSNTWLMTQWCRASNSLQKMYVNGSEVTLTFDAGQVLQSNSMSFGNDPWTVGQYCGYTGSGANYAFSGDIDEIAIDSVVRSAAWAKADYHNLFNTSGFLSFGPAHTAGSVPPSIATLAPDPVGTDGGTLKGFLGSTGTAATVVHVYWEATGSDQGTDPANWDHPVIFDGYAPGNNTPYATNITADMAPGQVNTYRYYASNGVGVTWGASVTFTNYQAPVVTVSEATDVSWASAKLYGAVTAGVPAPLAYFCLDSVQDEGSDGPTNDWQIVIPVSAQSGAFSITATGLIPETDYYCRTYATNGVNAGWSANAVHFRTIAQPMDYGWDNGSGDGKWSTTNNWNPNAKAGEPDANDNIAMHTANASTIWTVAVDTDPTVSSLLVQTQSVAATATGTTTLNLNSDGTARTLTVTNAVKVCTDVTVRSFNRTAILNVTGLNLMIGDPVNRASGITLARRLNTDNAGTAAGTLQVNGGSLRAYVGSVIIGQNLQTGDNGNSWASGSLNLSACSDILLDVSGSVYFALTTAAYRCFANGYLYAGGGSIRVGGNLYLSDHSGWRGWDARMWLTNTTFELSSSTSRAFFFNQDGSNTRIHSYVSGRCSGLDLARDNNDAIYFAGANTTADNALISVNFTANPRQTDANKWYWGLRWKGNRQTTLRNYRGESLPRLKLDVTGLSDGAKELHLQYLKKMWPATYGGYTGIGSLLPNDYIIYDSSTGYTYVGVHYEPAGGTIIMLR